jgi:hypothetical protein
METTEKKMNFAMKKLSHLLKTTNKGQLRMFLTLLCVAIGLFFVLLI